jgi:hypothetical protein
MILLEHFLFFPFLLHPLLLALILIIPTKAFRTDLTFCKKGSANHHEIIPPTGGNCHLVSLIVHDDDSEQEIQKNLKKFISLNEYDDDDRHFTRIFEKVLEDGVVSKALERMMSTETFTSSKAEVYFSRCLWETVSTISSLKNLMRFPPKNGLHCRKYCLLTF